VKIRGVSVQLTGGGRTRLLPCPKCRSFAIWWSEIYEQPFLFQQSEHKGLDPNGSEGKAGDIIAVRGSCRGCGHRWQPRGVRMITDLPGYPSETP
jgi:hypothetical protein